MNAIYEGYRKMVEERDGLRERVQALLRRLSPCVDAHFADDRCAPCEDMVHAALMEVREEALEEAAALFDDETVYDPDGSGPYSGSSADSIRSLKKKETQT